jgi:hypothetical protein
MAEKHSESECVLLYALYCEGSFDAHFTKIVFGSYFCIAASNASQIF